MEANVFASAVIEFVRVNQARPALRPLEPATKRFEVFSQEKLYKNKACLLPFFLLVQASEGVQTPSHFVKMVNASYNFERHLLIAPRILQAVWRERRDILEQARGLHFNATLHEYIYASSVQYFVEQVVVRSGASLKLLRLALFYIHMSRGVISTRIRFVDRAKAELAILEADPSSFITRSVQITALRDKISDPMLCRRRAFLAALMHAFRYEGEEMPTDESWSLLSGLSIVELQRNMSAFKRMSITAVPPGFSTVDVEEQYMRFSDRLQALAEVQLDNLSLSQVDTSRFL